jgi:hypothetical protein
MESVNLELMTVVIVQAIPNFANKTFANWTFANGESP